MPDQAPEDQQLLTWVPRLRRYARALAGNRDDADDLVQDTLERAWAKSGLWGGPPCQYDLLHLPPRDQ